GMFFITLMIYTKVDFNQTNDRAFGFVILPLILALFVYVFYRKLSELFFFRVKTKFDTKENRLLLYEFYKTREESVAYIRFNFFKNSYPSSINNRITYTYIIIKDEEILFAMLTNGLKLNVPVITSHLFLRYDLKKFYARKHAERN
ncbi:MAG: hypothetical protein ACRC3B_19870, partial [Bacteroidia bacterium]